MDKGTPAWEEFKNTIENLKDLIKKSVQKIDDRTLISKLQKIDFYCTYNEETEEFEQNNCVLVDMEKIEDTGEKKIDLNLKTSSIQRKMNRGDGQFRELAK